MQITRIETAHLHFEYEQGFTYAGGTCTGRVTSLVRVHTDEGAVGIGSAYSHPGLVELVVKQHLEPLLIGSDPTDVETLWQSMYRETRWYGRKGAAMSALGALDTAFWDLRGQAAGQPVWKLCGGQTAQVPAYASALLWKAPDELASEAQTHRANGFRRMKMRLGRGANLDRACVSAVRAALGSACDLMVDGSMRYNVDEANELAAFLMDHDVFWFEEPFEPEDLSAFAELRKRSRVPIAAGENEFGVQGFRELMNAAAVDIAQPDASRCGGVSEVARVAELARERGIRIAPHSWSDAVAIVANAHIVAASDNGITVEIDQTGNPFVEDLLVDPLAIRDGILLLADRPGLGIELREDAIARHRLADPMRIPPGCYSDFRFEDA